jgi:hypothetical protein
MSIDIYGTNGAQRRGFENLSPDQIAIITDPGWLRSEAKNQFDLHYAHLAEDPRCIGWEVQDAEKWQKEQLPPKRFPIVPMHHFKDLPEIAFWDDAGMLPKHPDGCVLMMYGVPGSHKSNAMLALLFDAVLRGGARAVYVAAEGQYGIGHIRVPAICKDRGIEVEELENRLDMIAEPMTLADPQQAEELIASLVEYKPDIVVVDTLTQVCAGIDSNAQAIGDLLGGTGAIGRIKSQLKCLVAIIAHESHKNTARNKVSDVVGHFSQKANTDVQLHVTFEHEIRVVEVEVTRSKDGPEGARVRFSVPPPELPPVLKPIVKEASPDVAEAEKPEAEKPEDPQDRIDMLGSIMMLKKIESWETGLTDHQLADLLHPEPVGLVAEAQRAEWEIAHQREVKRLNNAHGKEAYMHLCHKRFPAGKTRAEWRWFYDDAMSSILAKIAEPKRKV